MENDDILREEEQWDFDEVVVSPGVTRARSVVSVAFSKDDFEAVARAAESKGMKTSAFIRNSALISANVLLSGTTLAWAGSSLGVIIKTNTVIHPITTDSETEFALTD